MVSDLDGNVVQRTNYYTFGLPMNNSTGQEVQPYKYNGKEYETISGINLYDYHARQQDPILGRFTSIDPLAGNYFSISPYVYCANNPLRFIDPDGMAYTSNDPNQWADLLRHISSGGSVNSFDTGGGMKLTTKILIKISL